MAARALALNRSSASPTAKSCPIRCVSVSDARTRAEHDAVSVADGLGEAVADGLGGAVGLGVRVGAWLAVASGVVVGARLDCLGLALGVDAVQAARRPARPRIRMRVRTPVGRRRR